MYYTMSKSSDPVTKCGINFSNFLPLQRLMYLVFKVPSKFKYHTPVVFSKTGSLGTTYILSMCATCACNSERLRTRYCSRQRQGQSRKESQIDVQWLDNLQRGIHLMWENFLSAWKEKKNFETSSSCINKPSKGGKFTFIYGVIGVATAC